jgi:hypothetical protein
VSRGPQLLEVQHIHYTLYTIHCTHTLYAIH